MRTFLALLLCVLGISSAAAQAGNVPLTFEQRRNCRAFTAYYEQRLSRLETEFSLLDRDFDAAADYRPTRTGSWEEDRREHTLLTIAIGNRLTEVRLELRRTARLIKSYKEYCPEPVEFDPAELGRDRTGDRNLRRGLRLSRDIDARLAKAERGIDDVKKRFAEFQRKFDIVLPALVWAGLRIEVAALLGWLVHLNDPNLNPFNQEAERSTRGLNGGGQVVAAVPLSDRFDARFGAMVFFADSAVDSIRNLLVAGSLVVNGHYNTTALLATFGLGVQLFDRWYAAVDVGAGAGLNDLLIRNGTTGQTIVDSQDTAFAWMARASLLYAVTDDIRVGLFLGYLATEAMDASLANGTPFSMGGLRNVVTGIALAYAFGQSSQRLGRNAPPLR